MNLKKIISKITELDHSADNSFDKSQSSDKDFQKNSFKEGVDEGCGTVDTMSSLSPLPPPPPQQDSVTMNVSMNGSGKGGIRDLLDVLKNIDKKDNEPADIDVDMDTEPSDKNDMLMKKKLDSMAGMIDDDYANSAPGASDATISSLDTMTQGGNDLHKEKDAYPQVSGGNNAMRLKNGTTFKIPDKNITVKLENLYQEIKNRNLLESTKLQRHPLAGHEYHKKSDNQLHYIVKDAGEAAKSLKGTRSEGKYLDQVNDASTVLHFRKSGMPDWYKKKYGHLKEEVESVAEGMDPEKRSRLDDLISQYRDAVDPEYDSYNMDDDYIDADDVIAQIRAEFGDKIANQVEAGAYKMHFTRPGHTSWKADPLGWKKPVDRITKAGKMYKQDSDYMKNTIKARYKNSGKSATEGVAEGKFVKAAGGVPSDRHGNPLPPKPPKSVSTMTLKQLEKNKRENLGQSPFKTQDKKVKKYLGLEEEGVAEGLVGDIVVHNYTKMPIDLKPGQAQIHGWGPNDQPIYRVKGHDGKEVITSNKKKMMMIAQRQGVEEGSEQDDDYSTASFEKWKKQKEYEREYDKKKPAKPTVPDNKNKKKGVAEGKDDKIAQLKKDYETAVHWSKNDTSPQKREAARQKAEKIKRHLETQYKQGVAEGSLNEVTQGVEHSEWVDNVKDHYYPTPVKIVKKRTEDGRHIGSHAMIGDKKVGQYNMNTGVGTFTSRKKQGVSEGSEYTEPKLGTIKANLMRTTKPTVQIQVFKHNTLRGDSYWVTKEVRTFKTMDQAQAYVDRINKQSVAEARIDEFYDEKANKPEGGKLDRLVRRSLANKIPVFVLFDNKTTKSGYVQSEHPVKGFLVIGSGRKTYTTFNDETQKATKDGNRVYIQPRSMWNASREIDLDKGVAEEFRGELDSKGKFTKDTVQKMFGKLSPDAKDVKEQSVEEGEYKSRHIHRQEQNKKYDEYRRSQEAAGKKPMSRGEWAATQRKGQQGVAEGYSLKKTNVSKYMEPGDTDEYTQDINIKDTDYKIINNKTGQVVGTASWTTNDFMGPGALKITMRNGATRYLDIWASEKGNPQTAFNRFVKDPKTAKKYKEQGVAEGSKIKTPSGTYRAQHKGVAKPRNPVGMGSTQGRGTQKHQPNQRQIARDEKKL